MPIIVVHEMGKQPQTAALNKTKIVLGRDENADIVLNNVSVSRQHAEIRQLDHTSFNPGGWVVVPMNLDNPVVLDGTEATGEMPLAEGTKLQLGRLMVIFSLADQADASYLKDQKQYEAICNDCDWSGVFSALLRSPQCPKCSSANFRRADDLQANAPAGGVISGATTYLTPDVIAGMQEKLIQAKQSRIQRTVTVTGFPDRFSLTERTKCVFGKDGKANMPIEGFMVGKPAEVAWDRAGYVLRKGGFWPKLKVNGSAVTEHRLKHGDFIELGKNQFRFTLD